MLLALFVGSMVLVNTIGTKITSIAGIRVSVGIFFMPLLFLITDIVGEVHGRERAGSFVRTASGILIFSFAMVFLSIRMTPNATWGLQEEYALIFGSSLRMTFASIISFIISQSVDVTAFAFWKRVTRGRYLWLRNNLSTIFSQFIDTVIFMFIAFYRINPSYTAGFIFSLIIPYWLFKVLFALLDTPLCYIGVRWLKSERKKKTDREKSPVRSGSPS
jgi:queuosine precursor transporter